ncbi:unnamed protein product [Toxocara canis]|uniref:Uracil-DNA glycosylase n=1 Tax=Toxocara canis TaxID=6265 RepID=A0A183UPD6_TOXCA|nr:unnamed protein product [Toxocara canis]
MSASVKIPEMFRKAAELTAKNKSIVAHVSLCEVARNSDKIPSCVDAKKANANLDGNGDGSLKPECTMKKTTGKITVPGNLCLPTPVTPQDSVAYLKGLITDSGWRTALDFELRKDYMHKIVLFLESEREKGVKVFPPRELIFNAFNLTPLSQIRVVIIGQDPYHDENQACACCFFHLYA